MPLTDEDCELAFAAWAARRLEDRAIAVPPEYLPSAERLRQRGYLAYEPDPGDDAVFQFTDAGMAALEMGAWVDEATNPN